MGIKTKQGFKLESLRLPQGKRRPPTHRQGRPPRPAKGQKFLKGPIPWNWLLTACALPGKALAVALQLWFMSGIERSDQVALNITRFAKLVGVSRDTVARSLIRLEEVGLVSVQRSPGSNPRITILECTGQSAPGTERND